VNVLVIYTYVLVFTAFLIGCTVFFMLIGLCIFILMFYWCKDYCHRVTTQLLLIIIIIIIIIYILCC
jgi:hypothetical protein